MDNVLPIVVVVLIALACPLCMVVMGGVAWVVARAGARKRYLPDTTGSKP